MLQINISYVNVSLGNSVIFTYCALCFTIDNVIPDIYMGNHTGVYSLT